MDNQIKAMQMLSKKKSTSHMLHLLLSLVTVGLWIPVWIIVCISNAIENYKVDRQIDKM